MYELNFNPGYKKVSDDVFKEKIAKLYSMMSPCVLCPLECRAFRKKGESGRCGIADKPMVSTYHLHFGEESFFVGNSGSGTIFFTGCNLSCVYCQNWEISHEGFGTMVDVTDLADMMLTLQNMGALNINLVTPTHQLPFIVEAIYIASKKGLCIPTIYNSSGYESVRILKILSGIVDIYMPDAKYGKNENGLKYSKIPNYFDVLKETLKEMHKQVGVLIIRQGIAVKGLLVRHLVLPNDTASSYEILKFIANDISKDTYINIMAQYHPSYRAYEYPELSRRITDFEYRRVVNFAKKLGLKNIIAYQ